MEDQLWQELYEKTITGKLMWRRVGYHFETEVDGRAITLSWKYYDITGTTTYSCIRLYIKDKTGTTVFHKSPGTFWHKPIAKKLYDYIGDKLASEEKQISDDRVKETIELIQRF